MVIESDEDSYPGFGYHQQNYTAHQNGYYVAESEENSYPKVGHNQHYPTQQNGRYYSTNNDENNYYSTNDHYKAPSLSHQPYHHSNSHVMPHVAACAQPQPGWRSTNSGQYFSIHDANGHMLQYNRDSVSKFCAGGRFVGYPGIENGEYGTNDYGTRERVNHEEYSNWGGDNGVEMYQNMGGGYNGYQQKAEWVYTKPVHSMQNGF